MKLKSVAMLAVFCTALVGCAIAEGPREKLNQGVYSFNEGLRWGRSSDVLPVVDADALDHFQKIHEDWGRIVQISSAEVTRVVYDDKNRKAEVNVQFSWFRKNEMLAYDTVTKQHWEYRGGKWWMMAEEHVSGQTF